MLLMKTRPPTFTLIPLLLLWLTGCSKPEGTSPAAAHGHEHGHEAASDSASAAGAEGRMCTEHNVRLIECGICQPQLVPGLKTGEGLKIRLPAADSADIAGVRTATPVVGAISDAVECYAELDYNHKKLAQIAAPVGGVIQEVAVDLGTTVQEKETVAKIWSAAIAEAVAKAVLSHQTLERERKLRTERVSSQKDLEQAEAEHRAACQQLRTVGFTEAQVEAFVGTAPEQVLMEVRAPFGGEIIEANAVRGALVEAGKSLFTLADRSVMWAMLSIPEASLGQVAVGQTVELRVESLPGRTFQGKLAWIASEVDERSRMTRARAEIPDPERLLKARMFATARVLTRSTGAALLLPPGSIQQVSGKSFVFVKLAADLFEARVVRIGARYNGQAQIAEGLSAHDVVAVDHAFPLKSALLISRLGAGCADD